MSRSACVITISNMTFFYRQLYCAGATQCRLQSLMSGWDGRQLGPGMDLAWTAWVSSLSSCLPIQVVNNRQP